MNEEKLQHLEKDMLEAHSPSNGKLVPGDGNPYARIMFIGHSASSSDNLSGLPYSGPAGLIFDQLLAEAGLARSDIYLSNLVKIWTFKEEFGTNVNRTPTMKEIKAWAPFLERELLILNPVAIVALGSTTAQFFLSKSFKLTASGGLWQEIPDSSPYLKVASLPTPWPLVMGLAQPSYLLHLEEHVPERSAQARADMVTALKEVKQVLLGKKPEPQASDDSLPF
ncbi:MAG: uracil-DNA glycosylase [Trueperaceae bacterium]|nr:uracil-DNA glycosylase [Trueperaceae bacterium]